MRLKDPKLCSPIVSFPLACLALMANAVAYGQSNVDNSVPNKFAYGENTGWTNWRDANEGASGVSIGGAFLSGYAWAENVGWINFGDGTPANGANYANTSGADFGVNINPDGTLHGYAWGENIGWINFDGGGSANPPQPAYVGCDGRLHGYAWAENVGWLNLSLTLPGQFVAVDSQTVPYACDMNHDGAANGRDVQAFVDRLLAGGADWRDVCSGDVDPSHNGMIDLADVMPFVACLLN